MTRWECSACKAAMPWPFGSFGAVGLPPGTVIECEACRSRKAAYELVEREMKEAKALVVQDWHGDIDGPDLDWSWDGKGSLIDAIDLLLSLERPRP